MAFNSGTFNSGLSGLFGGLFGHSNKPYDRAIQEYINYANQGVGEQRPYTEAGKNALTNYQDWLNGQKNPAEFINNLVGQYSQSPYTTQLQQQAQRAGENAASASGLVGSTPFLQAQQQNAANIGQQGLNDWLQNVLGINTQYGQGQQNLVNAGQGSANTLTNLFNTMGQNVGEGAYGSQAGKQQDLMNLINGIKDILGSFL